MKNEIIIDPKSHYGTEHIYVVSEHAEHIKALTGSKCLSRRHIEALQAMGFIFKVKQQKLPTEE
jgi:hypothetical protein